MSLLRAYHVDSDLDDEREWAATPSATPFGVAEKRSVSIEDGLATTQKSSVPSPDSATPVVVARGDVSTSAREDDERVVTTGSQPANAFLLLRQVATHKKRAPDEAQPKCQHQKADPDSRAAKQTPGSHPPESAPSVARSGPVDAPHRPSMPTETGEQGLVPRSPPKVTDPGDPGPANASTHGPADSPGGSVVCVVATGGDSAPGISTSPSGSATAVGEGPVNSAGAAGQVGGTDPSLRDGDRDGDGEAQGRRPKRGASERARERMQRLQGASDGEGDSDEQGTPGPDTCGKRPRRGGASAVLSRDAALGSRGEAGREVGERKQRRRRAEGPVGAPGRERKKGREAPAERGRKEEFFLSAEERRRRREEEAAREQALAELKRKEAAARARDQFQAEIARQRETTALMNQGKRSDNPFFRTVQLAHEAAAERRAASAADESASGDGPAAARSLGRQLPPVHVGVSPPRGVAGEGGPTWTALWAVEERGVASLEEVLRRAQSMGDGIAFRMVLARKPEEGGAGGVDGSEKAGWSVNALLRAASVRLAMCDEEEPGEVLSRLEERAALLRDLAEQRQREAAEGARKPQVVTVDVSETESSDDAGPSADGGKGRSVLWVDAVAPDTADQVCGNFESVRKLRQWLRDWADSIDRETRDAPPRNVPGKRQRGRGRGGACSDDSDDDSDGGASLNPAVILLHGPPGCGKSAAVAACARELGFKRIEVNPASDRSGAHLHRLIGEATKSRNIPGRAAAQKSAGDKVAAMFGALRGPVVGAEAAGLGILVGRRAGGGQGAREAGKTVVVLEEVDVLLEEDRGFAGALAQLMQETKRPMVLTASTATPACLPAGLGVRTVRFGRPSVDEVLETLVVACAALCEVPPRLEDVEVLAAESGGDVRKAIHAAQLWLSGDGRGARAHERCGGGSAGSASGALESAWGAVATMGLGAAEQGASARKVAEAGKGGGDVSEEMSRVERELERRVLDRLAETAPHVTKRRGGRDALAMMQARTGQRTSPSEPADAGVPPSPDPISDPDTPVAPRRQKQVLIESPDVVEETQEGSDGHKLTAAHDPHEPPAETRDASCDRDESPRGDPAHSGGTGTGHGAESQSSECTVVEMAKAESGTCGGLSTAVLASIAASVRGQADGSAGDAGVPSQGGTREGGWPKDGEVLVGARGGVTRWGVMRDVLGPPIVTTGGERAGRRNEGAADTGAPLTLGGCEGVERIARLMEALSAMDILSAPRQHVPDAVFEPRRGLGIALGEGGGGGEGDAPGGGGWGDDAVEPVGEPRCQTGLCQPREAEAAQLACELLVSACELTCGSNAGSSRNATGVLTLRQAKHADVLHRAVAAAARAAACESAESLVDRSRALVCAASTAARGIRGGGGKQLRRGGERRSLGAMRATYGIEITDAHMLARMALL